MVCCICLDDLNSNMKTLNCGHKFHKDCIFRWIETNYIKGFYDCPMCKKEYPIYRPRLIHICPLTQIWITN